MSKQEWDAGADLSPCRTFRYRLWRRWADDPALVVIGLNPSTADECADDRTIRKIVAFAKRWRFGAIVMLNLFAFRATSPADMKASSDPIGPDNDATIRSALADAPEVLCAWGTDGGFLNRDRAVMSLLDAAGTRATCLGTTKQGHPRHPLFVRGDTPRVPYAARA